MRIAQYRFQLAFLLAVTCGLATHPYAQAHPLPVTCQIALRTPDVKQFYSDSPAPTHFQLAALNDLKSLGSKGSIPHDILERVIAFVTPDQVARWVNFDQGLFDTFYRRLFENLDPKDYVNTVVSEEMHFKFAVLDSERAWTELLSQATLQIILKKLALITNLSQSKEIGIALSSQFSYYSQVRSIVNSLRFLFRS